jgi:hypothetical protein
MLGRALNQVIYTATHGDLGRGGGTTEQVESLIAGSAEYFQVRGGGTDLGFLQALYQDALNRAIDPAGQMTFSQALAKGATRAQVAAAVFTSLEFRQDLVESGCHGLAARDNRTIYTSKVEEILSVYQSPTQVPAQPN